MNTVLQMVATVATLSLAIAVLVAVFTFVYERAVKPINQRFYVWRRSWSSYGAKTFRYRIGIWLLTPYIETLWRMSVKRVNDINLPFDERKLAADQAAVLMSVFLGERKNLSIGKPMVLPVLDEDWVEKMTDDKK